ncbi:uncharacterized protein LOC121383011 isoform X2 [Gigantopelta aegis]|uniref:uncharacterized protein LOC121383011 isoform X2 n=1 Tax=Gigantopelta aegis TaxID=1735272 RepID=UPI001B888BCD|nr:uncharacterized protein LOC121383011 isoform X2 [Gigantopelta aegis]
MAAFKLIVLLGIFCCSSFVHGQTTHELYERMIDDIWSSSDDNDDGIFSQFELIKTFSGYDTNGDGTITRHEYVNHVQVPSEHVHRYLHALFDIFDVNGDHHFNHHDYHGLYTKMDKDCSPQDQSHPPQWLISP